MKKNKLLLGGHVSISGGLFTAFERTESINCTAMQIFTKSNRQWAAKELTNEDIKKFKEASKKSSVESVVVHASYLINIASSDTELLNKSISALTDELKRCDLLNIPYLILHPGTNKNIKEGISNIIESINKIYNDNINTTLLLENMAGQGSSVAYRLEHLDEVCSRINNKAKIGICLDTCHLFASGYDISDEKKYHEFWKEFDNILGLNLLKVFHINDSKKDLGSKVDRHEFLGKGKIGKEAFKLLINDKRFLNVIKILETPIEEIHDYIPDIRFLVQSISKENYSLINESDLIEYLK